jgi:hypothetical protein
MGHCPATFIPYQRTPPRLQSRNRKLTYSLHEQSFSPFPQFLFRVPVPLRAFSPCTGCATYHPTPETARSSQTFPAIPAQPPTPRERNNLCPSSIWKQRNSPDSPADRLGSKARQGSQVDRHRRGRADDSGYVSRFACVTRHPANSRQTSARPQVLTFLLKHTYHFRQ